MLSCSATCTAWRRPWAPRSWRRWTAARPSPAAAWSAALQVLNLLSSCSAESQVVCFSCPSALQSCSSPGPHRKRHHPSQNREHRRGFLTVLTPDCCRLWSALQGGCGGRRARQNPGRSRAHARPAAAAAATPCGGSATWAPTRASCSPSSPAGPSCPATPWPACASPQVRVSNLGSQGLKIRVHGDSTLVGAPQLLRQLGCCSCHSSVQASLQLPFGMTVCVSSPYGMVSWWLRLELLADQRCASPSGHCCTEGGYISPRNPRVTSCRTCSCCCCHSNHAW
jgi:hypothetical protein